MSVQLKGSCFEVCSI